MTRTILITGGAGYIGSHTCLELLESGYAVAVVDNLCNSSREALRRVDTEALTQRMGYRYPPGAVRRLDDALLWVYGDAYVDLRGNADRSTGGCRAGGAPTRRR